MPDELAERERRVSLPARLRAAATQADIDDYQRPVTVMHAAADELKRLAHERDAAVGLLREIEFGGGEFRTECPVCHEPDHTPDCPLAALLAQQPADASGTKEEV